MNIKDCTLTRVRIYAEGVSAMPRSDMGELLAREIRIQPALYGPARHAIISANLPYGARERIKSAVRQSRSRNITQGQKIGFGWEKSVYKVGMQGEELVVGRYTYENVQQMRRTYDAERDRAGAAKEEAMLEWKRPIIDRLRHIYNMVRGTIAIERARKQLVEEHKAAQAGMPVVPTYYAEAGVGIISPFINHPTAEELVKVHPELRMQVDTQLRQVQMVLVKNNVLQPVYPKNIFLRYDKSSGRTTVVGLIDLLEIGEHRVKV